MIIFDFDDYKHFVRNSFELRPKKGRGEYRRLADHLRMSSVAVSQVFRGERDLSLEQALQTAKFLLLDKDEQDFFLLLVEYARAGSKDLKTHFADKIKFIRTERQALAKRVRPKMVLTEEAMARFYSNWQYSAVRMASSIPGLQNFEAIAERLGLEPEDVAAVGHFLLEQELCIKDGEGIRMGPATTMLSADSHFINNHRRNWRLKGLEHLQKVGPTDLFYSGVVSLSEKDVAALRNEFMTVIEKFTKKVQDSDSETIACLNLDWFRLQG